jgi:hypothetical protein
LLALAKGLQIRRKGCKTLASLPQFIQCVYNSLEEIYLNSLNCMQRNFILTHWKWMTVMVSPDTAQLIFYRGINSAFRVQEQLASLCRLKALKLAKKFSRKVKENTSLELG